MVFWSIIYEATVNTYRLSIVICELIKRWVKYTNFLFYRLPFFSLKFYGIAFVEIVFVGIVFDEIVFVGTVFVVY